MGSTEDSRVNLRLLTEEISFARILAGNDKRLRDRGVKRLRRFLIARSQRGGGLSKDDYLRLWKGLFYCMWMSDKPLVQEQLAEDISLLVHCFSTLKESLMFVECFFSEIAADWYGIDQLRLDKFMMLVRRFIRQSLVLVSKTDWRAEDVKNLADYIYKVLSTAPIGLCMHIVEVFCEELAKVGEGKLSNYTIVTLVYPFAKYLSTQKDGRLISDITRYIFLYLIRQTEKGIEHQIKFSIWKERGFAGGSIDAVQKVEAGDDGDSVDIDDDLMEPDSEEEEMENEQKYEIDARAGRVDVLLPPLDFDPQSFVKMFNELKKHKETTTKARKTILQLIDKFSKLHEGKYPLGLQKVELLPYSRSKKNAEINAAAHRLVKEQMNYEMNGDLSNGLEEEENDDDDDDDDDDEEEEDINDNKMSMSKSKKRIHTIKKRVNKGKEIVNTWKVCDTAKKENKIRPVVNKSWKVSTLDASAIKGVKRKHKETEVNMSSGKFIVSELNKTSEKSIKKQKNKTEEGMMSNTLHKQQQTENVNNMSAEDCNIFTQGSECKAESIDTVAKQSNVSNKLKQNSSKKSKVKGNDEVSPKVNGLAKENGNISKSKISDWGGEWDVPVEDGEIEIIIPNKQLTKKQKLEGQLTPSPGRVGPTKKATPENRINK